MKILRGMAERLDDFPQSEARDPPFAFFQRDKADAFRARGTSMTGDLFSTAC